MSDMVITFGQDFQNSFKETSDDVNVLLQSLSKLAANLLAPARPRPV